MFKYFNINPHNEKLPDCVCRAISLATGADYYDVKQLLLENGLCYECDELTVECYSNLLNDIGYKAFNGRNANVAEILKHYPSNTLLLRLQGHLTCAVNGICYDLWDCTGEPVDIYWVVE